MLEQISWGSKIMSEFCKDYPCELAIINGGCNSNCPYEQLPIKQ